MKIFILIGWYNNHPMVTREFLTRNEAELQLQARLVFCPNYDKWEIVEKTV